MAKRSKVPASAYAIRTFAELEAYLQAFAKERFNLLIIVGRGGLQKSQMAKSILGKDVVLFENQATPFGMYKRLYWERDKLVLIDDIDSLYTKPGAIQLLKCLCQTDPVKRISWDSNVTAGLEKEGIPSEFFTRAKVCIIGNIWKTLDANGMAVEDRGHLLHFDPSPLEIYRRVAGWFWDQEVYNFIGTHLELMPEVSMRDFLKAWELKQAGMDWRSILLQPLLPDEAILVAWRLKRDPTFANNEQRVAEFERLTGKSRPTYYNYLKRLKPTTAVPEIQLQNLPPEGSDADDNLPKFLTIRGKKLGNG